MSPMNQELVNPSKYQSGRIYEINTPENEIEDFTGEYKAIELSECDRHLEDDFLLAECVLSGQRKMLCKKLIEFSRLVGGA